MTTGTVDQSNQWKVVPSLTKTATSESNKSSTGDSPALANGTLNLAPGSPTRRRNLVDMIQDDFPRTPSPIHGMQLKLGKSNSGPAETVSALNEPSVRLDNRASSKLIVNGGSVSVGPSSPASTSGPLWGLEGKPMAKTPPFAAVTAANQIQRSSSTPPTNNNIRMALHQATQSASVRYTSPAVADSNEVDDEQFLMRLNSMHVDAYSESMSTGFNANQAFMGNNAPASPFSQKGAGVFVPNNESWNEFHHSPGVYNTMIPPPMYGRHSANGSPMRPQAMLSVNMNKSPNVNAVKYAQRASKGPESPLSQRSSVLEEFRNSRNKNFDLKDILGYAVEFSSDQHGSRFIQQKLEVALDDEKAMLFEEIHPQSLALMSDVFGNYVIQKFFEHGSPSQRIALVDTMKGKILNLTLQMYGCRVVQKALEHIPLPKQLEVVHELDGNISRCIMDQNGNHVVQKAIECIPYTDIYFILEAFKGQAYELATHPYGCRVIQRIFEHCPVVQMEMLMVELRGYVDSLLVDQYGNYVIQNMLEKGNGDDKEKVINIVRGQILPLSKHKFASNVVEKSMIFCSEVERRGFIEEIVQVKPDGTNPLLQMMKDQYANYVIQTMLDVTSPEQRAILVAHIKPHFSSLKKFTYGKHIISKIERLSS